MESHKEELKTTDVSLEDILHYDEWAREYVTTKSKALRSDKVLIV